MVYTRQLIYFILSCISRFFQPVPTIKFQSHFCLLGIYLHLQQPISKSVSISYNKLPQTRWLQTTEMHSWMVLEARNSEPSRIILPLGTLGKIHFLPLPASSGLKHFLMLITTSLQSLSPWSQLSLGLEPTMMTSSSQIPYINYICKNPFSK